MLLTYFLHLLIISQIKTTAPMWMYEDWKSNVDRLHGGRFLGILHGKEKIPRKLGENR